MKQLLRKYLPHLIIAIGVLYGIWPLDAIPDIPIVGWTDDIGVFIISGILAFLAKRKAKNSKSEL